jgi:hypothetical protein
VEQEIHLQLVLLKEIMVELVVQELVQAQIKMLEEVEEQVVLEQMPLILQVEQVDQDQQIVFQVVQ